MIIFNVNGHSPVDPTLSASKLCPKPRSRPTLRHGGARVPADQRVRRTGGQAEPPSDQVPYDRAHQAGHNHIGRDQIQVNEALAHRLGDRRAEKERRKKIEERGPQHRLKRREYPRGHDRGDGIRRIVKPVDVIEHQRDRDDEYGEREDGHASCS